MKKFWPVVLVAILWGCSRPGIESSSLKVIHLTCDYLTNPLGIDDPSPVFSWQLQDSAKGQLQTAYRIRVASSESLLGKGEGDIWDTGKKISDRNVAIHFYGKSLESGKRYIWNVQVWDKDGSISMPEQTAVFETGLLKDNDWKADWISAPTLFDWSFNDRNRKIMPKDAPPEPGQPAPILRKEFNLEKQVSSARIYITGLGFFELTINGQAVSDHLMDPAFTDYTKTVLYKTFDITGYLQKGNNAIGVMLGNGWYNMFSRDVWSFDYAPWRDRPVLMCQAEVNFTDGSSTVIPSDLSWKCYPGPVTFNSIRQGETYVDSLNIPGWDKPGFDDSQWYPVRMARKPMGKLTAMTMPSVEVSKEFKPVSITKTGPDQYLVDFGQAMAGYVKLKASGKPGKKITVKYGELIGKDGHLDQSNIDGLVDLSPFQTDTYIFGKNHIDDFLHPRFSYSGFQYVEIRGLPDTPEKEDIIACAAHTAFDVAGTFECSNDILNKIQHNTLWSFISNYYGYPTDCPHREKNGWTGDAQLASETGLYNYDLNASYLKWINDLIDEQHDDGMLPGIAPTAGWGYYWGNGPAWDHALFAIPWNTWIYTGDRRLLEKAYPAMKKYMALIKSRSEGYLTSWGLGDWCPARTTTPEIVTSSGFFLADAQIAAKTAALLGSTEEQAKYNDLADSIKLAYRQKLFNPQTGLVGNGSQTAQSTALYYNILNGDDSQKALEQLVENLQNSDLNFDVGILGAKFMLNALSDEGRTDIAYSHIASTKYPGWANWVVNGATTLWENWNGEASRIHIMYGDISAWFFKNLGGIKPDPEAPGFKHFYVEPYFPPDLDWVKVTHESPYGSIKSSWKKIQNGVELDVNVPVNSTATVILPGTGFRNILINDEAVKNSDLVTRNKTDNGKISISLASGEYKIELAE